MLVRNSCGDLVTINDSNYSLLWSIKFGKKLSQSGWNTVSVDKMKQYLSGKCYSL
jgi:hypothetical protein